ncbi:anaerobic ribonucleoside triphosphate reductase [Paenibacillus yanchengensis]|uniref:Anaerobic ribonucleoside triphosphate reductase n=1 Tax=Paenibacillus yanchengensis TaxID=2035833 RepID=A0ABW4YNX3_9BACL
MSLPFKEFVQLAQTIIDVQDEDITRENANMNGESFSGKMSKLGSEFAKWYAKHTVMPSELVQAIEHNYVYVHDLDQYVLGTTNCIFIPFDKLLARGFNTGNGSVRPPNSITTAMSLTAIIFQSQQNAQFGGVSANKLDWDLAPYINKSFQKHFIKAKKICKEQAKIAIMSDGSLEAHEQEELPIMFSNNALADRYPLSYAIAYEWTVEETNQAAEALIHNLNTMSSRAGGQIPFTSINYGTCTSPEGQLVIDALLNATIKGLGNGETPVFPIQIFKCKQGINQQPGEPNYHLFLKSIECASKRLYPNFANIDAPFNAEYYIEGQPDTEFATMGCRTRLVGDRFGCNHLSGKGNLSFNTINLVKLGIEYGIYTNNRSECDEAGFYIALNKYLDIALQGLLHRYQLQAIQPAKASDFMMREDVWEGGAELAPNEPVEQLLRHGSISLGFIGIAECMKALFGKHHAEDEFVYNKALELVSYMRHYCNMRSEEHQLNITLFATPAEGLSGKFTKIDRATYGLIQGVTDREYYTNSFHVPVYYSVSAAKKIQLEAPFHALCNAGAISYIELDGNARNNTVAFQRIVQYALEQQISYFSVNHPIDRCPACGYEGMIGETCPTCGISDEEQPFRRLRRVTGYLTGDYMTRFNAAKVAEVRDRLKHL